MKNYPQKLTAQRLLILLISVSLYTSAYCQKKTFSGYYIGKQGDSVPGIFPHYTQWNKNPDRVAFVPSGVGTATELTPENTRKFVIDNYDTYLPFKGQRMTNPIDFNITLANKDSFSFQEQYQALSTFVRLIAKTGNFELFAFTDNSRSNYFYRLGNGPFEELKFKMYFDQNGLNEVHEYRQQLSNLFKSEIEKRKISVNLERVNYTEESIIGLLEQLTPVAKRRKRIKSAAEGLVVALGTSVNFFSVTGESSTPVSRKYNTTLSPLFTLGYMSPFNRGFGKFFVYPMLKLYNFSNSGTIPRGNFNKRTTYKANLAISPLVNVGANIVNTDNFKYFISAGAGMAFLLKPIQLDETLLVGNNTLYQVEITGISKLTYNAQVSTGITLKNKIIFLGSYSVPVPIGNFLYYTPYHSNAQLTVGYKL